jgi:hypothetical protein
MVTKLERDYQAALRKRIEKRFPDCLILKNDEQLCPGIPDLVVFWGPHWAFLEVKPKKPTRKSDWRPNQPEYLAALDDMSFAACIYPENEEEVLYALQQAFGAG